MTNELPKITLRYYFSIEALISAYTNTNLSFKNIPNQNNLESSEVDIKYTSSVLSAVINSVIFMEATINELFLDVTEAKDDLLLKIKSLGDKSITQIQNYFKIDDNLLKKESILKKYNLALFLIGQEKFDTRQEPYQSAQLLIELRNHLTHYKIKTIDISQENSSKLEKKLKGKFPLHPLCHLPEESIYYPFPRNHLSHDCAKWAIESSRNFVEAFFNKIKLQPVYLIREYNLGSFLTFEDLSNKSNSHQYQNRLRIIHYLRVLTKNSLAAITKCLAWRDRIKV
ncbi:MAG: hypothetical protein QNJ32_30230 [Xenococcaceae cyanobacterium MO_167.B27]|nr:hypothetical protein [Xenococcaceae cyanobacterium MO_167.B27]